MSEYELFEIAKIVDDEYRGKQKTFSAKRHVGFWSLSTNVCDWASFIRVYETNNKISKIERLGDDTEGWQPIHINTWSRIEKYLDSLNPLTTNQ